MTAQEKKMEPNDFRPQIDLLQCPRHKIMALAIDGSRETGPKCCGSWRVVKTFNLYGEPKEIAKALERHRRARIKNYEWRMKERLPSDEVKS